MNAHDLMNYNEITQKHVIRMGWMKWRQITMSYTVSVSRMKRNYK